MDNIELALHEIFHLSTFAAKKMADVISFKEVKKGELFVKKDSMNDKEYLLLEGICRSLIINAEGQEITLTFFTKNSAISPNLIRCISGKSIINLQSLTDAKLAVFSTENLMKLMDEYREIELWANRVLQGELLQKVKKEINQNSLAAKERLAAFRREFSDLENLIPHPYIASYLGITNVSLSRLRKELANS